MITATVGTSSRHIIWMLRLMAPPCPRSSALAPGNAPGVSIRVTTGIPRRFAISITRMALRYPSGPAMPKLRNVRSLVSRPFCCPMNATGRSWNRPNPATMAWSSPYRRSPWTSSKSEHMRVM